MWWCIVASILAVADPVTVGRIGNPSYADLAPPIQLQAGRQPINVDMGHAAPFMADLKGDGKMVLLVGQFGEGKLRLYPNIGTKHDPRFDQFEWFQAGGKVVSVPFG